MYHATLSSRDADSLKSGNITILEELIKTWPDVLNLGVEHDGHPLMQTLIKDKFDLSKHLLTHGAHLNAKCRPDSRLGYYCRLGILALKAPEKFESTLCAWLANLELS